LQSLAECKSPLALAVHIYCGCVAVIISAKDFVVSYQNAFMSVGK
jgi:hypothetical protein